MDPIVEISVLQIEVDGTAEQQSTQRINPGCPIQPKEVEVHGITDLDVADYPRFSQVASEVSQ